MRGHRFAVIVVCVWMASPAGAVEANVGQAESGWLQQGRGLVRGFTEGVARQVDSWFGDTPFEQGGRVSGSIGLKLLAREGETPEKSVVFRANLTLPNLEDKAYVFLGRQNEDEEVADQPDTLRRRELLRPDTARDDRRLFAGLAYALTDVFEFRAGVRGGYKLYAQARYREDWRFGDANAIGVGQTFFWKPSDGVGSTTALNLSHGISQSVALRWQNAATITEQTKGFVWSSSLGAFKHYGKYRSASIEALVSGSAGTDERVDEYGLRAVWQQPLYRDWTRLEASLGHFWPQVDGEDARRRWAFSLGVDVYF